MKNNVTPELAAAAGDLMETLRALTDPNSKARRIVGSAPKGEGFKAWKNLNTQFGLPLVAQQAQASR